VLHDSHFIFLNLASLISVAALALKDQIKLRAVLLVSILSSVASHVVGRAGPQWNDLFWNGVQVTINVVVLVQLILSRTHIGLTAEQEELFKAFHSLTPGEFRGLVRLASWETAAETRVLTTEGEQPEDLFYVLRGAVEIEKSGRVFQIEPRAFIGEVAFLHSCPASATVRVEKGARLIRWNVTALEKGLDARSGLRVALMRLIGLDMAAKVARA
jgi:CRP-like cAMP-binding protein